MELIPGPCRNKYIIAIFAPILSLLAPNDPLIYSSGVATFVPTVLTPELATMLVIQDFRGKINEEQARAILKESAELGIILHDEEDGSNGNYENTVPERYNPSNPQIFGHQPRPMLGTKHGHRPAPERNKIKIASTSKLLSKGSRQIISDEDIDELA